MKGSVSDTLIHIKVSETAMNNAVFEAAETVETWQWKVLSYAPLAAHPLQGTCPRARWVSMLLLEWLRQQCDHPAQGRTLRGAADGVGVHGSDPVVVVAQRRKHRLFKQIQLRFSALTAG